jgi:hypothetical protein
VYETSRNSLSDFTAKPKKTNPKRKNNAARVTHHEGRFYPALSKVEWEEPRRKKETVNG